MTKALLTIVRKQIDEVRKDPAVEDTMQDRIAQTLQAISQLLEDLDRRIDALERRK